MAKRGKLVCVFVCFVLISSFVSAFSLDGLWNDLFGKDDAKYSPIVTLTVESNEYLSWGGCTTAPEVGRFWNSATGQYLGLCRWQKSVSLGDSIIAGSYLNWDSCADGYTFSSRAANVNGHTLYHCIKQDTAATGKKVVVDSLLSFSSCPSGYRSTSWLPVQADSKAEKVNIYHCVKEATLNFDATFTVSASDGAYAENYVNLQWDDLGTGWTYDIYYGTSKDTVNTLIRKDYVDTSPPTAWTHQNLEAGKTYYYKVVAKWPGGGTKESNVDAGNTKSASTSCPGPYHVLNLNNECVWSCAVGTTPGANNECVCQSGFVSYGKDSFGRRVCTIAVTLNADDGAYAANYINLQWNELGTGWKYDIYYGTSSGSVATLIRKDYVDTSPPTAWTHQNLEAGKTYYYKVIAKGPNGQNITSNVDAGSTKRTGTTGSNATTSPDVIITADANTNCGGDGQNPCVGVSANAGCDSGTWYDVWVGTEKRCLKCGYTGRKACATGNKCVGNLFVNSKGYCVGAESLGCGIENKPPCEGNVCVNNGLNERVLKNGKCYTCGMPAGSFSSWDSILQYYGYDSYVASVCKKTLLDNDGCQENLISRDGGCYTPSAPKDEKHWYCFLGLFC